MSKQQKYPTDEFRREAVRLVESSGKSVPELAHELGVSEKSLYRWRKQYGTAAKASSLAKTPDVVAMEAELKQLDASLNKFRNRKRDMCGNFA